MHQIRLSVFLAVAVLLAGAALSGCLGGHGSPAADKAGALSDVVVLHLGDADTEDGGDLPVLAYLARQAEELSDGTLRIDTTWAAAGGVRPDAEQEVARMVREGKLDLGYVGADGWDELGVRSFDALYAPLLIDDDALLNAVANGRLATEALNGLHSAGVSGLALIPRSLGPPVGLARPFTNPADFAGARVVVTPSKATDAALRALGARPIHVSRVAKEQKVAEGHIDGELPPLDGLLPTDVVTGNAPLLPKLDTLFANPDSLAALSDDQRLALREAAAHTVDHAIATRPTAQAAIKNFCATGRGASPSGSGRVVFATASDLAAFARAARPVYAKLRADRRTREVMERIGALKRSLPPAPPLHLPRGCSTPVPARLGCARLRSASDLNGTYRWLLTDADAYAFGPPATEKSDLAGLPHVTTMTLRNGRWQFGTGPDRGTYAITANRISFAWPAVNSLLTFRYSADAGGDLHLVPLASVERGDRFVWSSQPWQRVGPPVRAIP